MTLGVVGLMQKDSVAVLAVNSNDGPSIWIPMLILYLVLGMVSSIVAIKTRGAPAGQLRQQTLSWWRIFPVVSISLYFTHYTSLILSLLIVGLSIRELAAHYTGRRIFFLLVCGGGASLILGSHYALAQKDWAQTSAILTAVCLLFLFKRFTDKLLYVAFFLSGLGIGFLISIEQLPFPPEATQAWLFYLLTITAISDIAQFATGKLAGIHKIAPRISPHKSWEGIAGGVIISLLVSAILGHYLRLTNTFQLALIALVLSLGGLCGDLLFSAIKRLLKIKDFSQLIPGQGGILDRVDSLVLTAPLLYGMIYFLHIGSL